MVIVGIDPGPVESAWCELDTCTGEILGHNKEENEKVRRLVLPMTEADQLYIEMIASYGMPVGKEVFETCVWVGRFMEYWRQVCLRAIPERVTRKEISLHLCNSPRANDSTVRRALLDRFGPQGTKKQPGPTYGISKDVWSALAVCAYAADVLVPRKEEVLSTTTE